MKNVHSILHLFGEQRMVFKNPETSTSEIERHFAESGSESIKDRIEKLQAVEKLLTDKTIDSTELDTTVDLEEWGDGSKNSHFSRATLDKACTALSQQVFPGENGPQRLQKLDLIKSFEEKDKNGIGTIEEKLGKNKDLGIVRFKKNGDKIEITGAEDEDDEEEVTLLEGGFDLKSSVRKNAENNRDNLLKNLAEKRAQLEKDQANIEKMQTATLRFAERQQNIDDFKFNLRIENNPETNGTTIVYTPKDNPKWPVIRIDVNYAGDDKFETSIVRVNQQGEVVETVKLPKSTNVFPEGGSKEETELNKLIGIALEQTSNAGAYVGPKAEIQKPEEPETKTDPKQEEKPAEKIEEVPAIKVEPHSKGKVKTAEVKDDILTVTTKRGTKYEYRQTRAADGTPIWEYLGKDADKGGEYYLDDGTRVEKDGSKFIADNETRKEHLKSGLIGESNLGITRNKAFEEKQASKAKTGVDFTVDTEAGTTKEDAEGAMKTANEMVQKAFESSTNEYELADNLRRIEGGLRTVKQVKKATFNVGGGSIEWSSKDGFGNKNDRIEKLANTEVSDKAKSMEELNSLGIKILSPEKMEKLTIIEFNALKLLNSEIKNALETGENAYAILSKIEDIGDRLDNTFVNSGISKVEFGKLNWEKGKGFENNLKEKIYEFKKQQLGEGSEEYAVFMAKSKTEMIKTRGAENKEKSKDYYTRALDKLTTQTYNIDKSIIDMSKEDFVANWVDFSGRKSAIEQAMSKPPFGYEKEKVPGVSCDIIFGSNMFNLNSRVNFEDIFDHEKAKLIETYSKSIPKKAFKDSETFIKTFKKLSTSNDPENEELAKAMFNEVIMPCLDILKSYSTLTYSERDKKKIKETDPEQIKINKDLEKLCNFEENGATKWEGFLNAITGGETKETLTIQTIDGQTSFMDEGIFLRHNSPEAALAILRNRKGLYTLDENGRKKLDKNKVLEEVNKLMKLGYANMELAGKKVSPAPVTTLDNLTKEQKLAFQFGFIVDQASRSNAQMQESLDIIAKTDQPVVVEVLKVMMQKGIAPKYLAEIRDKLVAGAVVGLEVKDGAVSFTGAGIGVPIQLSDNLTLVLGAGGSSEGFAGGAALNITVYRGKKVEVSVPIGVSTGGVGTGVNTKIDLFGRDLVISAGFGTFGVGGNIMIELENMTKKAENKIQKNLDASQYADLWKEWKELPATASVEEKYEALKQIKPVYDFVSEIQKSYDSTNADIVFMLELVKEQIVAESLNDLKRFFITHLGFGVSVGETGATFLPTIGFNLGGVEVFIPNRREIARIMSQLSDTRVRNDLEQSLKNLEESLKNGTPVEEQFMEKTPDLTYDPRTGKILSLVESQEIDLSNWQTDLEAKNRDLAEAEIKLTQVNDKVELSVQNTEDKDVEIIVDPALSTIAVIKDKNHLYLEGNINDLIITRERFTTPYQIRDGGPAIVDRIVIRQKASVQANRDIDFMTSHSTRTLRQNMGDQEFTVEEGALNAGGDLNIFEVAGYSNSTTETLPPELQSITAFYQEQTPDLSATYDSNEVKQMSENVKARREAMGTITKKEYEEATMKLEGNFDTELDKLLDKNKKFKSEFEKAENAGGDPTEVAKLIVKYWPKELGELTSDSLGYAVTYIENKWYSQLAKTKDGREKILARLKSRIEWVKTNIILPEFIRIHDKLGLKSSPQDMSNTLAKNMYEKLQKQLENDDFDFSKLGVTYIPEGSTFLSGSRAKGAKGKEGIYTKNIDYHNLPKAEELLQDFGFLDGTETKYSLTSTDQTERDIARTLLEIGSPIPEATETVELLSSPLARKIAALQAFELLGTTDQNGDQKYMEDPARITKMYKNIDNLTSFLADPKNAGMKETLSRFRELLSSIRASQISGETFVRKIGQTGLTVKILMNTNIVAGAYSKCANPSHYIEEIGTIQVLRGTDSLYEESTEVTDATMSKTFATVTLTGAVQKVETSKPESGKDTTKTTQAEKPKPAGEEPKGTPAHGEDVQNYQGEGAGLKNAFENPPTK